MADGMAAFVWRGGHDVAVEEVPRPAGGDGWAVVDVAYAGICGTDLHICAGEHPRAEAPLVLGHEFVGRLTRDAGGLAAGQPVAVEPLLNCGHCTPCRTGRSHVCEQLRLIGIDVPGGVAEQVRVPESRLIALPDDVELHAAAFVEPLAVTVHAVRRSGLRLGDTVMVAGAGPIGLGVAACARLAGAGEIFVSEPSAARRSVAEELGFTLLDPEDPGADLSERTRGELAAVVFDTAGHPAVAAGLASWTTVGGRIVFVGVYGKPTALDLQDIVFRELDAVGCRVYERADMETAVAMIATGRFDPSPLITGTVALADAPAALDRLRSGEDLKVLIDAGAR
ncbi:MAG: (R,R)-butanediol dehydrogenase / meso-butanediol dehydrogenase / diacetyl reductase [Solirubrobacteraceae bacterium]|nr:(R,R)-butanediol dehydrogenase / meso-butanediol dehydrogenase / diacetyl reductase [Solirubrobacteraceae bacterium]